jgi:cytochrome c oxidase subunit I
MTCLVVYWLDNEGMPRRYADYLPTDGFTTLNTLATICSHVLVASMVPDLSACNGPTGSAKR